ncbi:MAG: hypothetical protein OXC31_03665, partial [Spirochaetaceae bacterium]|nr:hypothetical protein [Spirochaetaceae bacterium]
MAELAQVFVRICVLNPDVSTGCSSLRFASSSHRPGVVLDEHQPIELFVAYMSRSCRGTLQELCRVSVLL